MIFLHDTIRGKVEFVPQDPRLLTMYVCGPTVYDVPHIGNARPAVVFDTLFRLLRETYGRKAVVYARNYTDIDDKIIARAAEHGMSVDDLTATTIGDYETAMAALNVETPSLTPRATEHMGMMVLMIELLVEQEAAYVSEGHVLFSVDAYEAMVSEPQWLTPENDELQAGARVETASYKRDQRDFVLWKPSKEGEPAYEGPLGLMGRPGWHIECSAMISKTLGAEIDIHGGGNDLMFPHHQCEIMQSHVATGSPLARYWLHNGMLTVDGTKMSKSRGNFITVPDALSRAHGEAVRYLLLSGHYRQPLDFTWEKLAEAKKALDRLYRAMRACAGLGMPASPDEAVLAALRDDLNTPQAFAALHAMADRVFQGEGMDPRAFRATGAMLGILQLVPDEWFQGDADNGEVEALISRRNRHRNHREYDRADEIRQRLLQRGIVLEDTPQGTVWHTA